MSYLVCSSHELLGLHFQKLQMQNALFRQTQTCKDVYFQWFRKKKINFPIHLYHKKMKGFQQTPLRYLLVPS